MSKSDQELQGIGGWLILLALAILSAPVKLFDYSSMMASQFNEPAILALTTQGSPSYDARWMALRLIETAGYGLGGIGAVLLIGLFFSRHRFFPLAFTLYAGWMVMLNLTSYYLVQTTPAISEQYGGNDPVAMGALLGSTALWTSYLWYSRRAKLTFVRQFYFSPFFGSSRNLVVENTRRHRGCDWGSPPAGLRVEAFPSAPLRARRNPA